MQPGRGRRGRGAGGGDAPARRLPGRRGSRPLSRRGPAGWRAGGRRVPQPLWAAPPLRPAFPGDETRQRLPRRRQEGGGHGADVPPRHGDVQPPPAPGHQLRPGGRAPRGGPAPPAVRVTSGRRRRFLHGGGRAPGASAPAGRDFQEGAGGGFPLRALLAEEPLGLPAVPGEHQAREAQRAGGGAAVAAPSPLRGAFRGSGRGETPWPGQRRRNRPERDPGPQPSSPPAPASPPRPAADRQRRGRSRERG